MTVPSPTRPPDPRGRRYSTNAITRARALRQAGWTLHEIAGILQREQGIRPTRNTIMGWVDEAAAERRRQSNAANHRRRVHGVITAPPPHRVLTDADLLALRDDGHSYRAISLIARRFYSTTVTENQVRHRLMLLGANQNPNKARTR